jgi:tight adherence protein B
MPFAAGIFMYLANPDYIMPLFTDPIGHQALAVAGVMQTLGYIIIKKLVKIKI